MTKKIISDIIVSKRSIRQISIPLEKKEKEDSNILRMRKSSSWQRKPLNPKFVIWSIAGICVLALFFSISILFSSATVIITPRLEKISFNDDTYTAKTSSSGTTGLIFEILNLKQTASETVEATEEKTVSQKASGKIVIYNNYSSASQRLINNTRFESKDGRIYRINTSVVVPGLKKVDGAVIPGSVEATVFADQAGENYNLKMVDLTGDFKIPGFKGDLRYDSFYARLKEDIIGGFVGQQRIVSDELRRKTEEILKDKLKEQLLKELYAVKPENYLIFENSYSINYVGLPDTAVESNKAKINLEGTLSGVIFNNLKLSKHVAIKKIENFDELPTELIPTDNFVVTFKAKNMTDLWRNDTLEIIFTGNANIKWLYDEEAIKKDLAGKKESEIRTLASKYQNSVSGLKVLFKPVWTRYFPDNINKIKITELDY